MELLRLVDEAWVACDQVGDIHGPWDAYLANTTGTDFTSFSHITSLASEMFVNHPTAMRIANRAAVALKASSEYNPQAEADFQDKKAALRTAITQYLDSGAAGDRLDALIFQGGPAHKLAPGSLMGIELPKSTIDVSLFEELGADHLLAALISYGGVPTLVVPSGFTPDELPTCLSFVGRAFSEPDLLQLGYAYEQATGHRRAPVLP